MQEEQIDYSRAQPRGKDLFKYAHQPLSTSLNAVPAENNPLLHWDEDHAVVGMSPARSFPLGTMVSVSTQTDYR